jgi:RsiW-degrading membrane proteinase PrsW (M82 family)
MAFREGGFPGPVGEVGITCAGRRHVFQPGQLIRIGRGSGNDVLVEGDQAVSRQHAVLSWSQQGWVFENVGQAPTFVSGRAVTRIVVSQALELRLGSPQGPTLLVEPGSAPAPVPQAPAAGSSPAAAPSDDGLAEALQILIPVRSWLHSSGWRQGVRLLVIAYALLPLVFLALFASSANLEIPGWTYSLYIAPLWAIGFWLLIRPGPVRRLELLIGAGISVWTLIWISVITININDHLGTVGKPLSLGAALGVGFNEEIAKALPVLLAGLILRRFRSVKLDVRMWMWLGTIAGLTFGVREAALYTSMDIVIIHQAQYSNQAVVAVLAFAERVFVDGFQHAVWAGISAFFIGMAVNYRRRRALLIIFGVSIPAILHALNDWSAGAFNSYWPAIIVQAFSLFLFLGYTMSAASIERRVRTTPMFRGESMLMEVISRPEETT